MVIDFLIIDDIEKLKDILVLEAFHDAYFAQDSLGVYHILYLVQFFDGDLLKLWVRLCLINR